MGPTTSTVAGLPVGTLLGGMLGWRMAFGAATAVALVVGLWSYSRGANQKND